MYYHLKDGGSWTWDTDGGRKSQSGCSLIDTHIRLYADGDDRMYNSTDGYYVVGTTHKDLYEKPLCNTRYGYSESASDEF